MSTPKPARASLARTSSSRSFRIEGPEQGFFYAKAREWVQIDPRLDHKTKHVYLVFLSLAEACARGQVGQVTKDLARFCCAGVNQKPMSSPVFHRAVSALEEHGLLELDSEDGACERDKHGRWRPLPGLSVRVHELPPDPDAFTGFRNIADLAATYPGKGWTEREYQRRIPSAGLVSNLSQGTSSENADHPSADLVSNLRDDKPVRCADSALIDQRPQTIQTTRAQARGGGWLEDGQDHDEDAGSRNREPSSSSGAEQRARSLLDALVMPHGPQYTPRRTDVEHVRAALEAGATEEQIRAAILTGIARAEKPAATVKGRCEGLWKIHPGNRRESGSQRSTEPEWPEWCGSCDEGDRTYYDAETDTARLCRGCHPTHVGWVERVPA